MCACVCVRARMHAHVHVRVMMNADGRGLASVDDIPCCDNDLTTVSAILACQVRGQARQRLLSSGRVSRHQIHGYGAFLAVIVVEVHQPSTMLLFIVSQATWLLGSWSLVRGRDIL